MPADRPPGAGVEARSVRTAAVWAVLDEELRRRTDPISVVDVGGGTGGFAVPLAQLGHSVTVVDPSPDALATLARRAQTAVVGDRIRAVQGDVDTLLELVGPASADLVLCHSLLEVVEDPQHTLTLLATVVRADGALSLLVANRAAAVVARALGGHLLDAQRALADADGRWGDGDGDGRRFDLDRLTSMVTAAGLDVQSVHGVRVVADLVPGAVADGASDSLRTLELALSGRSPYRELATQLHVLARRP